MNRSFLSAVRVLSLGCALAACSNPKEEAPSGDGGRDRSMHMRTCVRDFMCEDGVCECTGASVSGTECCDPDVCGAGPSSCLIVCEVCSCVGDCSDSGPADGRDGGVSVSRDGGRRDASPVTPECVP